MGGIPRLDSVKIFASDMSTDIKNTSIVNLVAQKFGFLGSTLGGWGPGGVALSNYVEIFVCCICWYQKNKTGALVWAKQKINIWRVHFGGSQGGGIPKWC